MLEKMDVKSQFYYKVKEKKKSAPCSSTSDSINNSIKDFLQPKRNCAVPTQGEFNNPQRINPQDDKELPSPDSFTVDDDDDEQSHFLCLDLEKNQRKG